MEVIKSGYSSYGFVALERRGAYFYVIVAGNSKGPYTRYEDAVEEYSHWCAY